MDVVEIDWMRLCSCLSCTFMIVQRGKASIDSVQPVLSASALLILGNPSQERDTRWTLNSYFQSYEELGPSIVACGYSFGSHTKCVMWPL